MSDVSDRYRRVAGKFTEMWGRLTDNELRRQRGYQLVVVGQMRVLGGQAVELLRYCTPRQALECGSGFSREARR